MQSAIYVGSLRHRRFTPREHSFSYPLFLMFLDLAEVDTVFAGRWLWSTRGRALGRFARSDHFGDPKVPLDVAVRDLVEARTGRRPTGAVRLLTHLRYFGYCFNPVSFYYCYAPDGVCVEAIVAEVTNTPWGERHCYVLDNALAPGSSDYLRFRTPKALHVSPFMPMSLEYQWGLSVPGERLSVHMALHDKWKVFDATMHLERRAMTGLALARTLAAFPFMTGRVIVAIHWQALKLWIKGVRVHTHPENHKQEANHA